MHPSLTFLATAIPAQFFGAILGYDKSTGTPMWWMWQATVLIFFGIIAYAVYLSEKRRKAEEAKTKELESREPEDKAKKKARKFYRL